MHLISLFLTFSGGTGRDNYKTIDYITYSADILTINFISRMHIKSVFVQIKLTLQV